MKTQIRTWKVSAVVVVASLFAGIAVNAATTRLDARGGSKMRLEGTSTVHDWRSESGIIRGYLEVGQNFPLTPGQKASPGKVDAKGEAIVSVKSLKSKNKDGSYYDDKMDDKMYAMMSATNHPNIVFQISSLELKDVPADAKSPYGFDAKGTLAVAGVTNAISFPVKVQPLGEVSGDTRVKVSGEVPLKMTQFGMNPATMIVVVKTADDVTAKFDWIVGVRKAK